MGHRDWLLHCNSMCSLYSVSSCSLPDMMCTRLTKIRLALLRMPHSCLC